MSRAVVLCWRVGGMFLSVLCVLVASLVFASAPALALGEYVFSGSFASPGSGSGQLSDPAGVAVSETGAMSGDVYVVDRGNDRVEVFDSKGVFLFEFDGSAAPTGAFSSPETIAVDNSSSLLDESAGDVYVADTGHRMVDKFSATGTYLGQLTSGGGGQPFDNLHGGVAVDSNGTVWVYQEKEAAQEREIDSYSGALANEFLSTRVSGAGGRLGPGLAVDGEDNLYVISYSFGTASKLNSAGEVLHQELGGVIGVTGVAVDPSSNAAYVGYEGGTTIGEFDTNGSLITTFGSEQLDAGSGIAVSGSSGRVYVADSALNRVDVFAPMRGAGISKETALRVLSTSATLGAQIDPNGSETSYHFEYDTSPYGSVSSHGTSLPVPNAAIGAGSRSVAVTAGLQNLAPGTTYHYRVVAVSEVSPGVLETFDGPDKTLATPTAAGQIPGSTQSEGCANEQARAEQPYGLGLPDCRAFEMVSPADKNDNDVDYRTATGLTSFDGEGFVFSSIGAFAEPASNKGTNTYLARRGVGGWSAKSITPQYRAFDVDYSGAYKTLNFTPDLSKWVTLSATPLTADSPTGYNNLYVGDNVAGSFQAVTTSPPEGRRYEFATQVPVLGGASTDLSHVVFQDVAAFTPDARPEREGQQVQQVYEWADGKLQLVDIPPEGAPPFRGHDTVGAPATFIPEVAGDVWHAVSADGSRVFFTAGEREGSNVGQLYLREVNDRRTIEVSASQRTVADPGGDQPARFWAASVDGGKVLFTSCAKLTNDSTAVSTEAHSRCKAEDDGGGELGAGDGAGNDLYEYDVGDRELTDLTVDGNTGDPRGAAVLGVVSASEDASYVYFVAEGDLAGAAAPGRPNLYVRHAGVTRFIGTLGKSFNGGLGEKSDGEDWGAFSSRLGGPASHSARVTPGGTELLFASEMSLTGYDNTPVDASECKPKGRCQEVYLYDATTATLRCVSCNPSGARPIGQSELATFGTLGASLRVNSPFFAAHNLSDDGSRAIFESYDALVPHDSNGRLDVYEYENGHVYLLSDGAGNSDSTFLEGTADSNDVFVATADQLLAQDRDNNVDVYDVRVDGGFPVAVESVPCDNGDACKPPVSPQPTLFGAPASATFSGAGNVEVSVKVKTKPKPKHGRKRKARHKKGKSGKASGTKGSSAAWGRRS